MKAKTNCRCGPLLEHCVSSARGHIGRSEVKKSTRTYLKRRTLGENKIRNWTGRAAEAGEGRGTGTVRVAGSTNKSGNPLAYIVAAAARTIGQEDTVGWARPNPTTRSMKGQTSQGPASYLPDPCNRMRTILPAPLSILLPPQHPGRHNLSTCFLSRTTTNSHAGRSDQTTEKQVLKQSLPSCTVHSAFVPDLQISRRLPRRRYGGCTSISRWVGCQAV